MTAEKEFITNIPSTSNLSERKYEILYHKGHSTILARWENESEEKFITSVQGYDKAKKITRLIDEVVVFEDK